jgi:hypothetical protein
VAGVVATLVVVEAIAIAVLVIAPGPYWQFGMDYEFYRGLGVNWLDDGSFYQTHQLTSPYTIKTMVDNVYPPHALLLFVPFAFLPAVLWWAVPMTILANVLAYLRPARWAWVVILILVAWPRSITAYLLGNTDIWVVAILAAAIRWGWPAVFVTLKPSFAPFVLLGVKRPWHTAATVLALLALVVLGMPLWFDYALAIGNLRLDAGYSLGSLPLMLVPIVARLASTRKGDLNPTFRPRRQLGSVD